MNYRDEILLDLESNKKFSKNLLIRIKNVLKRIKSSRMEKSMDILDKLLKDVNVTKGIVTDVVYRY
jgi:hypothetical protein